MLSAATGALVASVLAGSLAHADTTINSSTSTALTTSGGGNITIDATGSVAVSAASSALTLNSGNFIANNGGRIANTGTGGAFGVMIDTSAANIVSTGGLANFGAIDLSGAGSGKNAIMISGGNTYFGNVTLGASSVGSSSVTVQGDTSSAFYLANNTKMDGNLLLGGSMAMGPASGSQGSSSTLVTLDGKLNGNVLIDSTGILSNLGSGARGVQILGGIGSCASDAANFPSGFACAAASEGSFVNQGIIQVVGTQFASAQSTNPESGSALVIGGSIAGGFVNGGPATANASIAAASITSNGLAAGPTLLIDPSQALTPGTGTPRGPIVIGPVTTADATDPGYSFINRGTISAVPTDAQLNAAAVVITGASPVYTTTLTGGLLNTGTISAQGGTVQQTNSSTAVVAMRIDQYATVPKVVVAGQTVNSSTFTPGIIKATMQGNGGGSAYGIVVGQNASVPLIDVKQRGTISASVETSTVSPGATLATSVSPFSLNSVAIWDLSGSIQTINNAGAILAANTRLTPASGAVVTNVARAIDLQASQLANIKINNTGTILGDIVFGTVGNGRELNVGNTGNAGTVNTATGVLATPSAYAVVAATSATVTAGAPPITTANTIAFGTGVGHQLHVGGFGYVNSVILAGLGGVDINVENNGTLFIANTAATGAVNARDFNVNGGTLGLTISQQSSGTTPIVRASNSAYIDPNAKLGLQFGSFVSSGTTSASVNNPLPQNITLVTAPVGNLNISNSTLAADNAELSANIPFLFQPTATPLSVLRNVNGADSLVLTLTPKTPAQLGLTGASAGVYPFAAAALANDPLLGASIASGITNTQTAQSVFAQFTPDVSGGARQVAILITDQATGPVAARQRLLRSFVNEPGEMTLWGEEFAATINNKGRVAADGTLSAYKDRGFGFAVGVDGGSPRGGWYGGAISFYSGDVTQTLPRATKTHTQWYMLTAYSDWRGKKLFVDTQLSLAYGDFDGKRSLLICPNGAVTCTTPSLQRDTVGKRAALMAALGATTGAMLRWNGIQVIPHIGLDVMSLREEGYTERGGGDGMDLMVAPYYANSIRTAIGTDFKTDIRLWDFMLTPEARLGYRYDFIGSAMKLKAGFASTGGINAAGNSFTFVGPDPDSGNVLLGFSLGAHTESWQFGVNYDWIRGNNGSTTQVGMLTILGRI
jgi:hypothetical protein